MAKPESKVKVTKSHSKKHFEMEEILGLPFYHAGTSLLKLLHQVPHRRFCLSFHDQTTRPFPPLEVGQEVRVAPLQKGKGAATGTTTQGIPDYLI